MLGDRDYDEFNGSEHTYLKDKIGFAYFGPPCHVDGYNHKQQHTIEKGYKKICETFGKYCFCIYTLLFFNICVHVFIALSYLYIQIYLNHEYCNSY